MNVQIKNTSQLDPYKWKPGESGNPNGRPAGSKDKKWASLDYWFGLVEKEWDNIESKDRVHVAMDAWKALLAKKQVNMTPEDSVKNADVAMNLLKILEDASRNAHAGTSSGSDPSGLADGAIEVQAEITPTPSL